VKAVVTDEKGVLSVAVKGAAGSFAATAPLSVTVRFPATEACGATDFAAPDETCVVKSKGKALACK